MRPTRRTFVIAAAAGAVASRVLPGWARRRSGPRVVFRDSFGRDRDGWGWPWFNQRYGRRWFVRRGRAVYRLPPPENSVHYRPNPILVLDKDLANVDLRATISTNNVTGRIGLVARAAGYGDYYAVYVGPGNVLRLTRCGHHHEEVLARVPLVVAEKTPYRLRLQVRGASPVSLRAKAWPAAGQEPGWMIDYRDASSDALADRGPFGVVVQHALDGRGVTVRIAEVVVWSAQRPQTTVPQIDYCLAAPPYEGNVGVVAKASVPARIGFEMARDPAFTQDLVKINSRRGGRGHTVKANLPVAAYGPSTLVYWRAFAKRRGLVFYGRTSTFRTAPAPGMPIRFAFGSCTKWQPSPRTSFLQARLRLPDFFLHQGDLGYVPHRVIDHAPDAYQDHWIRMLMDPHFAEMAAEVPVTFSRDDADYGRNLADAATLRQFTISAHDELHANPPAPYFSFAYGDVHVFVIDCRRFSSGRNVDEGRSKLGSEQKQWLLESMGAAAQTNPGLLVVASPQAFGSDTSPGSWRRSYTDEWSELVDFFKELGTPVLIVAGDAHGHKLHEYPQKSLDPGLPRIVEFVSAGTEQNKFSDEIDPSILVRRAKGSGFGLVELGAEREVGGQRSRTLTLTAVKSSDGNPFWSAQYVVVPGVGILPAGI